MKKELLTGVLIGAATGTLSGLTGAGGAAILVPLMVGMLSLSQHRAHGTSLAIVTVTALASGIQYARMGYLDVTLAVQLSAGSIIGAVIGARLMARVPARHLKRAFGVLLLALGVRMMLG